MDSYFPSVGGGPPPTVASYSDDPHQTSVLSPPAAFEIDDFTDEVSLDHTTSNPNIHNNQASDKSRRKLALMLLVGIGVLMACLYLILDQTKGESSVAQSSSNNDHNSDIIKLDGTSTLAPTSIHPHKHHTAIVNATDPLFQRALASLTQAIRETPETASLPEWYLFGRSTPPLSHLQQHQEQCTWYFPGLNAKLLQSSMRGQRLALVGDSTTAGLATWLQVLLGHVSNDHVNALTEMGLRNATHKMHPHHHTNNISLGNHGDVGDPYGTFVRYYNTNRTNHDHTPPPPTPPPPKQCAWPNNHMWTQIHTDQPTVMVVNYGLDLLHLMKQGHDTDLCTILQWKHYDHFLKEALWTAHKSLSVRLLLFKTTNQVCPAHYTEPWASGVTAYHRDGDQEENAAVLRCITSVEEQFQQQSDDWSMALTTHDIQQYCSMATMDPRGVDYLNQKVDTFVKAFHTNQTLHQQQQQHQQHNSNRRVQQQQQQQQQNHYHDPHLTVAIYTDHDIQSCDYTGPTDGRHFPSMNLARIRLLGNMIQCLYSY